MQGSELQLPGKFEKGKIYQLHGETLEAWRKALVKDRIVPGPGQEEKQTDKGRVITGGGGVAVAAAACPLGSFEDGEMVPGWVIGGGKNVLIEPGAISPAANKKVYIKATWTADLDDGVLMPGGAMGTVSVHTTTGNVPTDNVPDAVGTSGTAYYSLGAWDGDLNLVPSGCGTVYIGFCPGGFIKERSA